MKEGWICPRCGRVNAPFASYCDCKPNENNVSRSISICNHEWICDGISTNGKHYICKKCGAKIEFYDTKHSAVTIPE